MSTPQENLSEFDIKITGSAAADLRRLAQELEVYPAEVVADALALLRIALDTGLYVRKGRLTSRAPIMHALGLWREVMGLGATGRIQAQTRSGPVTFQLPPEAFEPTRVPSR